MANSALICPDFLGRGQCAPEHLVETYRKNKSSLGGVEQAKLVTGPDDIYVAFFVLVDAEAFARISYQIPTVTATNDIFIIMKRYVSQVFD